MTPGPTPIPTPFPMVAVASSGTVGDCDSVRWQRQRSPAAAQSSAPTTRQALVPPNPNELVSATRTGASRASWAT